MTNLNPDEHHSLLHILTQNLPIDIASIEDLAIDARNLRPPSLELDVDGCPAKVGAHGKVSNASSHVDGSSDVEEATICTRLHSRCCNRAQSDGSHDRADGKVEVRAADGNGDVDMLVVLRVCVDLNGIVSFLKPVHDYAWEKVWRSEMIVKEMIVGKR